MRSKFPVLPSLAVLTALLTLTVPSSAQETSSSSSDPILQAWEDWQAAQPDPWRLRLRSETGTGQFLYGAALEPAFVPHDEEGWFQLARMALAEVHPFFRIADSTLVEKEVHVLPLAGIGTTDKVSVIFDQAVNGVPVVGGGAAVLFEAGSARILGFDTTGAPDAERIATAAVTDPFDAVAAALLEYRDLEGREAVEIQDPHLVIYQHRAGSYVNPRLAWAVEMRTPASGAELPSGRRFYIAADRTLPEVLGNDQLVHTCGLTGHEHDAPRGQALMGNLQTWMTPGKAPDTASQPPAPAALRFAEVTSAAGSTTTDANGDWVIDNAGSNPLTVTFRYRGPLATVLNDRGSEYTLSQSFTPGVFDSAEMNSSPTEFVTAQANAYDGIIDFITYVQAIDPNDTTMEFQVRANVNLNATCNAFYNGSSINFYKEGGGCVNTAYSTVVAHEEGHWANDREGSGNGFDGFGEGNADVYAMYIYDTPKVGRDFFGPGTEIRNGNNTRQFCGDNNPGCYGEVHNDGEVLMGALWKVRKNLNNTLGDSAGDLVADTLFVNWMNAYNDGRIQTIIEEHWLSLDDDDGNIFNGTPNYGDIDAGFREQGFPGVDIGTTDSITLNGPAAASVGAMLTYDISSAEPSSPAFLLWSLNLNGTTINGQPFDIGDPVRTAASGTTDVFGSLSWTVGPVPANGAGLTVYVEARVDGPSGTADSNVLPLTIQ